jgi:precorrin-4/cobalt-precorrin-4 C11-methyltransferase
MFVGCGPGAPDLLTLRAVRALECADVVVWSPSLLDRDALAAHARPGAEIVAWPPATPRDILDVFARASAEQLVVVRLKGGDPTLLGQLEPELSAARELGLTCEIVPGVSAHAAAAAALGCELAAPAAPLLLADRAALADAPPGSWRVAIYGAGRDPGALQAALLARGIPASAPCVVAVEVSRRDEALVPCRLDELAETVADHGLGVLTVVLAGAPAGPREAPP